MTWHNLIHLQRDALYGEAAMPLNKLGSQPECMRSSVGRRRDRR
jgi:hypothetical protein